MKFDVPVAYSSEGDIERFVPGDALELPFAAFSHALHRVLEALQWIEALTHRAPVHVRHFEGHATRIGTSVFGLDTDDAAVLAEYAQRTARLARPRSPPLGGLQTRHRRRVRNKCPWEASVGSSYGCGFNFRPPSSVSDLESPKSRCILPYLLRKSQRQPSGTVAVWFSGPHGRG